jgi:hypothetical protein
LKSVFFLNNKTKPTAIIIIIIIIIIESDALLACMTAGTRIVTKSTWSLLFKLCTKIV